LSERLTETFQVLIERRCLAHRFFMPSLNDRYEEYCLRCQFVELIDDGRMGSASALRLSFGDRMHVYERLPFAKQFRLL
jgi:hypothetical protein